EAVCDVVDLFEQVFPRRGEGYGGAQVGGGRLGEFLDPHRFAVGVFAPGAALVGGRVGGDGSAGRGDPGGGGRRGDRGDAGLLRQPGRVVVPAGGAGDEHDLAAVRAGVRVDDRGELGR